MIVAGAMLTYRNQLMASLSYYETPHAEWGEESLLAWCRTRGRRYRRANWTGCVWLRSRRKRPRLYVFLDALPKNNYGKVLKKELRKNYGAAERA
jgi:long-chain acyl-CoA synthetase